MTGLVKRLLGKYTRTMAAVKQKQMLDVGARAPEFELQDLGGGQKRLAEILPKGPVLLAFFKTSCPVCQFTFPFLQRISRGLPVYGISQDDPKSTREFNARAGVTFPTLLDTEESGFAASNAYGISHVPSLFLVERDGAIVAAAEGFSRKSLQLLGDKAGVKAFQPGEDVPEWKAG